MGISGGVLVGLCFWLLPEASQAYVALARNFLPNMIYGEQFPIWHLHSLRGFWVLLLPGHRGFAEALSLVLSLLGIAAFYYFWRKNRGKRELLFGAAICLTIWITPHAMIYDWSILLLPAILFWQAIPGLKILWKPMFALVWIVTFISGPITYAQLHVLPIAIQVSIPELFIVYLTVWNQLMEKEITQGDMQYSLE
jgi:hypothetical protein